MGMRGRVLVSAATFLVLHATRRRVASAFSTDSLLATTEHGVVQGTFLRAANQERLVAFLGVPFAAPPVGDLRFGPPQDLRPWEGTRLATKNPNSCYQQKEVFFGDFEAAAKFEPESAPSEDCLYLNVYLPPSSTRAAERNKSATARNGNDDGRKQDENTNGLPVMVWFHGGSFSRGSVSPRGEDGWSPDPRELAAQGGVIVVAAQYRLGALGFLFLDDEEVPGNVGLLDQRAALTWVRRNIFAFGGDPTRVTLAGEDAGAVSAAMQLVSSRQLHQASSKVAPESLPAALIMHSAGIQHPWSFNGQKEAFTRALKLASLVGCPTSGSKHKVIECLRTQSAEDIVNMEPGASSSGRHPFVPTIDRQLVRSQPREMLRTLASASTTDGGKPFRLLIGSNSDEGSTELMHLAPSLFPNTELDDPSLSTSQFSEVLARVMRDTTDQVRAAARFQYTNWTVPHSDNNRFHMMKRLVADWLFDCPVQQFVDDIEPAAEIYRYRFSARSSADPWPSWTGVKRGDELDMVLGRPMAQPDHFGQVEKTLSRFMLQSWTNFVKSGSPSGTSQGRRRTVGWPRHDGAAGHVLVFTPAKSVQVVDAHDDALRAESCAFWNELVPLLEESGDRRGGQADCQQQPTKPQQKPTKISKPFRPSKVVKKPATVTTVTPTKSSTTTTTETTTRPPPTSRPPPPPAERERPRSPPPAAPPLGFFGQRLASSPHFLPPPVNAFSRHSPMAVADAPDFKVVDSTVVVNTERGHVQVSRGSYNPSSPNRRSDRPESKRLSYQLSVGSVAAGQPQQGQAEGDDDDVSSTPASDSNSSAWKLYRPEGAGNSPIYVAKGVFRRPTEAPQQQQQQQSREGGDLDLQYRKLLKLFYEQRRKQQMSDEGEDEEESREMIPSQDLEQASYFNRDQSQEFIPLVRDAVEVQADDADDEAVSSPLEDPAASSPRSSFYDPFNPSTYPIPMPMSGSTETAQRGQHNPASNGGLYFPNYVPMSS